MTETPCVVYGGRRRPAAQITCEWCGQVAMKATDGAITPRFCSARCAGRYRSTLAASLAERQAVFWTRVNKTDSCWLWTGQRTTTGYGAFSVEGRIRRTHQWSYEWANGSIPERLWILHKCDVPLCVNPDHLYAGTPKENTRDAMARGRLVQKNYAAAISAAKRQPTCKRGHQFDLVRPNGKRDCGTCNRIRAANQRARNKSAVFGPAGHLRERGRR